MRVATIDIGTNTVLLLVAEARADGTLEPILERATITRLGQGVDKTKALAPEALARTTTCIDAYADLILAHGVTAIDVVGTSAMRDAAGGADLAAYVKNKLGVPARVISGEEEARLTFEGALVGLNVGPRATVFDIGGGSTEVVQGTCASPTADARVEFAVSYDMGSVRMTERHLHHDPPTSEECAQATADIDAIAKTLPPLAQGERPVAIAGTMTTLAAIAIDLAPYDSARIHGLELEVATLVATTERLLRLPLAERRNVRGLEPKRADVIVGGALVATRLLKRWGAERVTFSDRGVRWGLALALCKRAATM